MSIPMRESLGYGFLTRWLGTFSEGDQKRERTGQSATPGRPITSASESGLKIVVLKMWRKASLFLMRV
jgi:hypothetical protein